MREPESRIAWTAAGVAAGACGLTLLWPPGRDAAMRAAGLGLGAAISLVNYAWLRAGVEALSRVAPGRGAKWGAARFLARFWLSAACLYAIFISHLVPFVWVLAGLFAVPAAALGEGVWQLIAAG